MHTKWLWDFMPCELRLDDPESTVLLRCVHTHEPSDDVKRLIAEAPAMLEALKKIADNADRTEVVLDTAVEAIRKTTKGD